MGKTALFGAAGAIGRSIARSLQEQQRDYSVIGRDRDRLQSAFGADPRAEIVTWNPDDASSIEAALRGVDTVIYLVGVPYHQFQLHPQLMQKTLAAARRENVPRLLLIGTVYPYGTPQATPLTEEHPRNPHTFKGRMRKEQEDLLLAADAAGHLQGSVLRLPDFYGPRVESSFLHQIFQAAAQGGTANLLGALDTPHEFVYVPDVGPVVVDLMSRPEAYGRVWHFAGPGTITQREVLEQAFRHAGRPPRFRVAGKTLLRLIGLFNPLLREMVEMDYLWRTPVVMDDSALRKLLGRLDKTPYPEGIRRSVDALRQSP